MSLPGLTDSETYSLERTIGANDSGYKREIHYPAEAGYLLSKSIASGSTFKTLTTYFRDKNLLSHDKMLREKVSIYQNIDKKYHKIIKYGEYLEQGEITFDVARIISRWPNDLIEEVIPQILSYELKREDLMGIKQRIDRGKVSLEVAIEEFIEETNKPQLVTFISTIREEETIKYLQKNNLSSMQKKLSIEKLLIDFFKEENRKLISIKIYENIFILTFLGKDFKKTQKEKLDHIVLSLIKKNVTNG